MTSSSQSASETPPTPFLDAEALRAATLARHVEVHDELGSTNDRAIELARDPKIELPALVVAQRQTAGRGRGRNTWWSSDGALTFSLLIDAVRSGIEPAKWPQLSLATAVAVCDALRFRISDRGLGIKEQNPQSEIGNPKSAPRFGIKWPNDVMLDGSKIGGILIESPGGAPPAKDRLIVGIGLNVNNVLRNAPQEIGKLATSLFEITHRQHDLLAILIDLLNSIASRVEQLKTGDRQIIRTWQNLDWLAGKRVRLQKEGGYTEGECVEIGGDGALVIDTAFGRRQFFSGTVRLVP